jgi:hypothetical protein
MRRRTADFLQGKCNPQYKLPTVLADTRKCCEELARRMKKRREKLLAGVHSKCKAAEGAVNDKYSPKFQIVVIITTQHSKSTRARDVQDVPLKYRFSFLFSAHYLLRMCLYHAN